MYKYNRTIRDGAEALIDGIENIEMFLDDNDHWNFHDSKIRSFYWDNETLEFTVTVDLVGYGFYKGEIDKNLQPLLDFHFKDCDEIKMDMVDMYAGFINEIEISRDRDYLECWFNGICVGVSCRRLCVDKPRFVPDEDDEPEQKG